MKFRLYPTSREEAVLVEHAAHARFVWNLGLEQANQYRKDRGATPGLTEQCRQLAQCRAEQEWLGAGSSMVQQQALRDLHQAFQNWWRRPDHFGRPTWRKRFVHESFRIVNVDVASIVKLNRRNATVRIPKVGRIRFRLSRLVPKDVKSFRVRRDPAGCWWVSFAVKPDRALVHGAVQIGIDRGIAKTLAFSDGTFAQAPLVNRARITRAQRTLSRRKKGSNRRAQTRVRLASLQAREADRVKDWIEKETTRIVRASGFVAIEKLAIKRMTRSAKGTADTPGTNVAAKAGLNRSIMAQCWGLFAERLREKTNRAGVELIEVAPAFTSQRCSACGHTQNADTNAALNILADGRAAAARGGLALAGPASREPLGDFEHIA